MVWLLGLFTNQVRHQDLALGSLFLAAKVEEHPRRIRDIVLVFDHVVKRARDMSLEPLEMFDTAFFELRNGLADGEMHILRALGFNVHVQHPHGIMINYLQSLGLASNRGLCQKAWNYLNDQWVPFPLLSCATCYNVTLSANSFKSVSRHI